RVPAQFRFCQRGQIRKLSDSVVADGLRLHGLSAAAAQEGTEFRFPGPSGDCGGGGHVRLEGSTHVVAWKFAGWGGGIPVGRSVEAGRGASRGSSVATRAAGYRFGAGLAACCVPQSTDGTPRRLFRDALTG